MNSIGNCLLQEIKFLAINFFRSKMFKIHPQIYVIQKKNYVLIYVVEYTLTHIMHVIRF